ncbi:unnamed protein product [Bathycoccus prasinos]
MHVVFDKEVDFMIKVSDNDGCGNDCLGKESYETSINKGLKCEVYVGNSGCVTSHSGMGGGDISSCLRWDNFYDNSKIASSKWYLSIVNSKGQIVPGHYEIVYNCAWYVANTAVSGSVTGWQNLHKFEVKGGCSEKLNAKLNQGNAHDELTIAHKLLLSSPQFLGVGCDSIDVVKEQVFRKYDIDPLDGKLSFSELADAFQRHDVDLSYLNHLNDIKYFDDTKGGILLSDVMNSNARPAHCTVVDAKSDVFITETSYPTLDSGKKECELNKEKVKIAWDFQEKKAPKETSDMVCIYADGLFYKKLKYPDAINVKSIVDERPTSGVGSSAISFLEHFKFEDGFKNSAPGRKGVEYSIPEHGGASINSCGGGNKCLLRTSTSSPFHLKDQQGMSSSSVMTWFTFQGHSGDLWRSSTTVGGKLYERSFRVDTDGTLSVNFYGTELRSLQKLPNDEKFHHVAMILNKQIGLSIFIDGSRVAHQEIIDNSKIDFPNPAASSVIFGVKGVYDDFRIYNGVVTPKHVKSVFDCGQNLECAQLAYAKPQSRRTYCIIPQTKAGYSDGFVPPCATGLFYNGAAIDLELIIDQKGILFSFRDTALNENSFEILRRKTDKSWRPLGDYEAVVLIDSALELCATTFSSITFVDDAAMRNPGDHFEYAIRTKFEDASVDAVISDPVRFKTPWLGNIDGVVEVGSTGEPVKNVRVCAQLLRKRLEQYSVSEVMKASEIPRNLAAYMFVWHSNQANIAKRSAAYRMTDQIFDTYADMGKGEYAKIILSKFSSIQKVTVCTRETTASLEIRVLDFNDPDDRGDRGSKCILERQDNYEGTIVHQKIGGSSCQNFICVGTSVKTYFGQVVTVKSVQESALRITQVEVHGVEIDCPYSAFSNEDGYYDIPMLEPSGELPKKMHAGVIPSIINVFDPIEDKLLLEANSASKPEALLLSLSIDIAKFKSDYLSTSLAFEAAGLGSKCNTELSIPGSGSDYVSIGSCASVTDFKPRKVEVQGAGIADNTMETNIHDFGGGTFVVAHQSSFFPFLYFMVEFHIKSENGQCFFKPLGAGGASILPPMSSEAKADVVHSWNNRHILKYATTPSEEGFGINTLYYEVDCPPPLPSSPPPSPPSPPPPSLDSVNFNKKTGAFIDKEEFISYAMNRTKYSDAHIILPDKFWSIVDGDGDGELNHSEFTRVVWAMDTGIIFGRPFLVFPSIETQYLTRFRAVNEPTSSEQAPLFATVPVPKGTIPYSQASWQAWYNTMSASKGSGLSFDSVEKSSKTLLTSLNVNSPPEFQKYVLPLATGSGNNDRVKFEKHVHISDRVFFSDAVHGISKKLFGSTTVKIFATERFHDVVHVFNIPDSGNMGAGSNTRQNYACSPTPGVEHQGAGACAITDDTVVQVTGMVKFPASRTQEYICGLQFASLMVTQLDELGNLRDDSQPTKYVADDLGRFNFAFTPGTSWRIEAIYPEHALCYGGTDLSANECSDNTKTFHDLLRVQGGESVIFIDITSRTVDLGLYAGACERPYEGYTLLITPVSGCGAPVTVSDINILNWPLTNPDDVSSNIRRWPYAAMDYYIQLETAPEVLTMSTLIEDKRYANVRCEPGIDMMQYFRDRDALVRTLMLLKPPVTASTSVPDASAKYIYHGWLCALPKIGDSPTTKSAFTKIQSPNEICLGTDLTSTHLIGSTNSQYSGLHSSEVRADKYVTIKIMEAHLISAKRPIFECSAFKSAENARLGVEVRIQQDVSSEETNPCHSKHEPSDECVFKKVIGDPDATNYGQIQFRDSEGRDVLDYFEIKSNEAKPNLVSPHRRKFLARIKRDDGFAVTTVPLERELVTLRSKTRGEGDASKRYISDTKFYATAPIRGLVYTVVHDPPGGNSYASIAHGTKIEMELGLTSTRAAAVSDGKSTSKTFGTEISVGINPNIGSAYANVEIEVNVGASLGEEKSEETILRERNRKLLENGPPAKLQKRRNASADIAKDLFLSKLGEEQKKADPESTKASIGLLKYSYEHESNTETEGPDVSVSATTDNSWDMEMILDRNLLSSTDPGLPGRPGDVILGGGFEIVYTYKDTLDVRSKCLTIVPEIQWHPRHPTSYVISVFTIEDRILTELERLIEKAEKDPNSIFTDDDLPSETYNNAAIKQIWKERINAAIRDWKNTLEWASPDFNPSKANTKALKDKAKNDATNKWNSNAVPLNSNSNVVGKRMKAKIDDVYKIYSRSDNVINDEYKELKNLWEQIPLLSKDMVANAPDYGTQVIKPKSGSSGWFPDMTNFVESFEKTGAETGKNVFVSEEKNSPYSRGMSGDVFDASKQKFGLSPSSEKDSYTSMDMVDASMFGGNARFDFGGPARGHDPRPDPSWGSKVTKETPVYLTFSGGGHNLEFAASTSENIDSWGYEWSFEVEMSSSTDTGESHGISIHGRSDASSQAKSKSAEVEHAVAWAKYGNLETSYVLGDPDPFDKFVIQVSTDKRFGTPLFRTIGGASKCPGEPDTLWRESGIQIRTEWAPGMNNEFIPPDSTALFDVIITNESPYRETLNYALALISGTSYKGSFAANMMDLGFKINGNPDLRPLGDAFPLYKVRSKDAAGNLQNTRLILEISKGNLEHEYSSIGVQVVSACEWDLSLDWIYREPISDEAFLGDFRWERKCPKVTWDKTTYAKFATFVASKEKPPFMSLTLMNPDPMNLWTRDRWTEVGVAKMKNGKNPDPSVDQNSGWDYKKNHLVHPEVQFVRIQWRKTGVGEWINAWDIDYTSWKNNAGKEKNMKNFYDANPIDHSSPLSAIRSRRSQLQELFQLDVVTSYDAQCANSRSSGCSLKWNLERQYFLNGFNDGEYEIRAKTFCSGYDAFATSEVRGSVTDENLSLIVDVSAPIAKSWSTYGRVFSVDYSELITCPQLSKESMAYKIKRVKTCDGTAVEDGEISDEHVYFNYKFQCMNSPPYSLMVEFPDDSLTPDGTYELTVNANIDSNTDKIVDVGGNPVVKQKFLTTVSCPVKIPTSSFEEDKSKATTEEKSSTTNHETCSSNYKLTEKLGLSGGKDSQFFAKCYKNPWNGKTSSVYSWRDSEGNVPFGISGSHGSCEDLCNRCEDNAGEKCLGFSVSGDKCFFRKELHSFKNDKYFMCSKKIAAADSLALGLGESKLVQETNWRFHSSIKFGVFLACAFFAIGFAASTASRSVLLRSNIKNEQESEQNMPIGASGRASYGSVL